ncbi:hypothetical protein HDF17_000422 [Granulicella arctica]|uniref:Uncharacterized protein n=1 Tax=Granulicella arctica TaxID=940613 RepID=A0A7Y9PEB6_9BACT|nr:hypothetical protein [Granulicella arctica]
MAVRSELTPGPRQGACPVHHPVGWVNGAPWREC